MHNNFTAPGPRTSVNLTVVLFLESCIISHMGKLLNVDANAKTVKGQKKGYQTGILYLAPANESGVMNVCPFASAGCMATCLNTAGQGVFSTVQKSRREKTAAFKDNRPAFIAQLLKEMEAAVRKAEGAGLTPVFRPNGTSDIPALGLAVAEHFSERGIQVYDYTKIPEPWKRVRPNYHLTFSRSETNWSDCVAALSHGVNVAVVFDTKRGAALPETWQGYKVIDGDETDLRFLDPSGVIVGLRAKGRAKKDTSGFVVRLNETLPEKVERLGNELAEIVKDIANKFAPAFEEMKAAGD